VLCATEKSERRRPDRVIRDIALVLHGRLQPKADLRVSSRPRRRVAKHATTATGG
jgi:hypothetical protein